MSLIAQQRAVCGVACPSQLRHPTRPRHTETPATVAELHARNPELRTMTLDRYGLSDDPEHDPATENDYQP